MIGASVSTNAGLNVDLSLTLPVVNEVKDLGVFVDSHLTLHSRIDKIVARALICSNLILKCFVSHNFSTLMRTHSRLMYCSPIIGICFERLVPKSDGGKSNKLNLFK